MPNFLAKMATGTTGNGDALDVGGIEGALKRKSREAEPEDREDREDEAPTIVEEEATAPPRVRGSLHFKSDVASKFAESAHAKVQQEADRNQGKPQEDDGSTSRIVFNNAVKQRASASTSSMAPKPPKKIKKLSNTKLLSFQADDDEE